MSYYRAYKGLDNDAKSLIGAGLLARLNETTMNREPAIRAASDYVFADQTGDVFAITGDEILARGALAWVFAHVWSTIKDDPTLQAYHAARTLHEATAPAGPSQDT